MNDDIIPEWVGAIIGIIASVIVVGVVFWAAQL